MTLLSLLEPCAEHQKRLNKLHSQNSKTLTEIGDLRREQRQLESALDRIKNSIQEVMVDECRYLYGIPKESKDVYFFCDVDIRSEGDDYVLRYYHNANFDPDECSNLSASRSCSFTLPISWLTSEIELKDLLLVEMGNPDSPLRVDLQKFLRLLHNV